MFSIVNSPSARHLVRIFTADERRIITTVQAVPMRRTEVAEDIVAKFKPTDRTSVVAMKGWFDPDSRNGHEFIYPEEQARHIAERTKTIVLAMDQDQSNAALGALYAIDAAGKRTAWHGDEAAIREWQ